MEVRGALVVLRRRQRQLRHLQRQPGRPGVPRRSGDHGRHRARTGCACTCSTSAAPSAPAPRRFRNIRCCCYWRQEAAAAGEMALDALGGFPHRQSRPRDLARAANWPMTRQRQVPRAAHRMAVRLGRLSGARRHAHQFDQRPDHRRRRLSASRRSTAATAR